MTLIIIQPMPIPPIITAQELLGKSLT